MMEAETTRSRRFSPALILLALLILVALAEMAWLSLARYRAFQASTFDLGNMAQAIWRAGQGDGLVFTTHGTPYSRLALHLELVYFLLAPLYRLFPSPETLLVVQAAAYAAGAWPLFRLARRRLNHDGAAVALAAVYLLYPVLQTAVLFDFHGDVLAVPFLLWAAEAADRSGWRGYGLALALALSCKVHVAAPVAAMGLVLWRRGQRRAGAITVAAAVAWGLFAFFILRPLFAPPDAAAANLTLRSYFDYYFGGLAAIGDDPLFRLFNLLFVLLPASMLAWRGLPWLLPALAVIGPVILSNGPGPSYDYRFHHYALAVPFLVVAMLYGLEAGRLRPGKLARKLRLAWHLPLALTLLLTLLLNVFLVDLPFSPLYYHPGSEPYTVTERDRLKARWLAEQVPPEAAVSAEGFMAAHLANRDLLYVNDYPRAVRSLPELLPELDVVVADALYDFAASSSGELSAGGVTYEADTIGLLLQQPGFGLAEARDGLLLFRRGAAGLAQSIQTLPAEQPRPEPLARFGDVIDLVEAEVSPVENGRYLARFQWLALRPLVPHERYVAVSRPEGLDQARIPHLPSLALLPTTDWRPGQVVEERFEFALPEDAPPGRYRLLVGWYDARNLYAAETDGRSRLGDEVEVGFVQVSPP